MRKILLMLVVLGLISCKKLYDKLERENEPDVYLVDSLDKEMNEAIIKANNTLKEFDKALNSDHPDFYNFTLKRRFPTNDGGEHIWINNIVKKNNIYYGVVGNIPTSTAEVKLGDTVDVPLETISDWMFFHKDKARGGYTIRVFRNKMSPEEKKIFDGGYGVSFED